MIEDGKAHKSDCITWAFKALVDKLRNDDPEFPRVTYYAFRRTGSSFISNESRFMSLDWIWLGHAPEKMSDKAYNAKEPTILDDCLEWLHGKIFGLIGQSEVEKC